MNKGSKARRVGNGRSSDDFDLSQHDKEYAEADVSDLSRGPIPDGEYVVEVEKVELTRAMKSGNPMLAWSLRILSGTYSGRPLWRNNMIVTPENIRWLKKDLLICGLDLKRISDLPENLDRLINIQIEVAKRTRGENENIFINRRVVDSEEYEEGSTTDKVIPF
jgi:hypothetical protein